MKKSELIGFIMMFGGFLLIFVNIWAWMIVFNISSLLANDLLQPVYQKLRTKWHLKHLKPKVTYDTYFSKNENYIESEVKHFGVMAGISHAKIELRPRIGGSDQTTWAKKEETTE